MSGAASRYTHRQKIWARKHKHLPLVRHHAWWLLHNCVSHPLLAVKPGKVSVWFHDYTSQHLNCREQLRPSPTPVIPKKRAWIWHNTVGHIGIGLLPIDSVFAFHDRTADGMGVEDWV